jgi:hypothetical protein
VNNGLDLTTVRNFSTALLIGALVGIEREKRTSAEAEAGIGGCESSSLGASEAPRHYHRSADITVCLLGAMTTLGYRESRSRSASSPPRCWSTSSRSTDP